MSYEENRKLKGNHRQQGNSEYEREHKYDDIIDLPHHVSSRHPRMAPLDRAAQFSPFAALTGHDAAIRETARLAESRMDGEGCQPVFEDGEDEWDRV